MKLCIVGKGKMLHAVMETLLVEHQVGRLELLAVFSTVQERPCDTWQEAGISFIQSRHGIQDPAILEHLQTVLQPDVILLASWGEILTQPYLEALAPIKVWNLHPSLLPAHRGVNPYLACILAGESESGLTLHHVSVGIDEGRILEQCRIPIDAGMSGLDLQTRTLDAVRVLFESVFAELDIKGLDIYHQSAYVQSLWGASHHRLAEITQVVLNPDSPKTVLTRQVQAVRGWMPCLLPLGKLFYLDIDAFDSNNLVEKNTLEWRPFVSGQVYFVTGKALYYKGFKCLSIRPLIPYVVGVLRFFKLL